MYIFLVHNNGGIPMKLCQVCHGRKKYWELLHYMQIKWSASHPAVSPGKECYTLVRVLDKSHRLSGCSDKKKICPAVASDMSCNNN
jgi:hypothetical protein